ncbi:hypothetical protein PR048_001958 [Dryococelus australis]|uniref:Glucosylceramidase n=1 Tax=Dryococelus australis TaxID=614101 RepID=A0ABQ9IIS5_9NEOP|nr:hypothetical protein PR048_001958 [Dryococelus australis]
MVAAVKRRSGTTGQVVLSDSPPSGSWIKDGHEPPSLMGGPSWYGNSTDSPIIVNKTADEFYKKPMFYAIGHSFTFVTPGSHRVALQLTQGTAFESVAFLRADGMVVIVLHNTRSNDEVQWRRRREETEKTHRTMVLVITFSTHENLGLTPPRIEHGMSRRMELSPADTHVLFEGREASSGANESDGEDCLVDGVDEVVAGGGCRLVEDRLFFLDCPNTKRDNTTVNVVLKDYKKRKVSLSIAANSLNTTLY